MCIRIIRARNLLARDIYIYKSEIKSIIEIGRSGEIDENKTGDAAAFRKKTIFFSH